MNLMLLAQEAGEAAVAASDSAVHSASAGQKAAPSVAMQTDFGLLFVLIVGLVALTVLIGLGVAVANGLRLISLAKSAGSVLKTLWVAPMLAAIGWFGYAHSDVFESGYLDRSATYRSGDMTFDTSPGNGYPMPRGFETVAVTDEKPLKPWVREGQTTLGGTLLVPVHSGWQATEKEAHLAAQRKAMNVMRADLKLTYPEGRRLLQGVDLVGLLSVKDDQVETQEKDLGPASPTMYREHLLVQIDDTTRQSYEKLLQRHLGQSRLAVMCAGGLLLTLLWIASAAYLRFDLETKSRYRGWLKTATTAGVLAGVLIAHGWLVRVADSPYVPGWGTATPSATADQAN